MDDSESKPSPTTDMPDAPPEQTGQAVTTAQQLRHERKEGRRWWIKLLVQPALLLASGALLFAGLGLAQQRGWISGGTSDGHATASAAGAETARYICPMMCTPPQSEPGRCPVCAMELVPAAANSDSGDSRSIQIDPAARRVAGIHSVAVKAVSTNRTVRAIGELNYDEGMLKTISAYVDGRIEQLYADYTGVNVQQGDHLARVYSPRLYSGQVEYLLAKKNSGGRSTRMQQMLQSNGSLQDSARQRLIEFGMTAAQIAELDKAGEANSRLHVCAPISGTVIEKLAAEGDYVKEGQPIYRLADLSTVWLMLELFPDDAATICYGQKVEATVQSLPGQSFIGRVAFIDPTVNPKTRTVGVRVVIPNPRGQLRVGDYAKATIQVPLRRLDDGTSQVFDPDLADKWISPRHPHIIRSEPGVCPLCGVDLVPATQYGFTASAEANQLTLVVPRDAVLMAGDNSVVYVEVEPGRFEIRRVTLGPSLGDQIVVLYGLKEEELVAIRGNFLIDSQMQLAGNPSLIDPSKLEPSFDDAPSLETAPEALSPEVIAALAQLSAEDRALAERQRICPVTKMPLGSMGTPQKVEVDDQTIFICCMGCKEPLLSDPAKHLANLERLADSDKDESKAIAAALEKLSPEDRALAQQQRTCPVADMPLGSMGTPQKVDVNGTPVFICCGGCRESLLKDPEKYLAKLAAGGVADQSIDSLPPMDLPPIEMLEIQLVEPTVTHAEEHSDGIAPLMDAGSGSREPAEARTGTRKEVIR